MKESNDPAYNTDENVSGLYLTVQQQFKTYKKSKKK